ncbi:MAG: LptF/LptG family permease [Armatimonadetes bacterium]|nr:LptF/LptG family permease [Armatimonadota bacterium]
MKRLDVLIINEIRGPWVFGVAMFTALIMAGSFLFKLTDYVVKGIDMVTISKLTAYLMPGIMAKTLPMAVLLAALLAFGRLSGDSEIVAVRASGASLWRIMGPVAAFGAFVAALTFGFNELLVPWAAFKANELQQEIASKLDQSASRPTSYPIYGSDGKISAQIMAKDFSIADRTLSGVTVTVYDKQSRPSFLMVAPRLRFELVNGKFDLDRSWRVEGGSTLLSVDGTTFLRSEEDIWPREVPHINASADDLVAANLKDLDAFPMRDMKAKIDKAKRDKLDPKQIANLEYGFWNKVAVPLAALVYALVGAPLAIRSHRTSNATGFAIAVVIIFGYMMLANFMAIFAQGGSIPAWVASFLPLVIGLLVAAVTIYRKNG